MTDLITDITNFLTALPSPFSYELSLLLSIMLVSLAMAIGALLRNRKIITERGEEDTNLGAIFEDPGSIMPHVIELRNRIIFSLIGVAVSTIIALSLTETILAGLAEPIGGLDSLQLIEVTESVSVFVRVAIVVGLILSSPYVIAQLWIFIAAGLKQTERKVFYMLFPFALFLFLSGVAFAYFVMLPVTVPFLTNFLGVTATPTLQDYVRFVTGVMLWVGISFEMPLVIFALAKAKIVNTGMLLKNWRVAIVLIAVLAAIVTPTPDPINMGIVAAPLVVLYLLSIILTLFA